MKISKTYIIAALLIASFFSCNKEDIQKDEWINAKVIGQSFDCGNWNIENLSNNQNGFGIFTEVGLPDEYKTENLQLELQIREPKPEESIICHATGIAYPLKVVTAVRKK